MSNQTFHGSCHCKAITFEIDVDLAKGTTKCNCTSCWKRRWWSIAVKPEGFRGPSGDGYCETCRIKTFSRVAAAEWNDGAYVSVNVACLDDLDPRDLLAAPVRYCDGRNDNWWQPPEITAHL